MNAAALRDRARRLLEDLSFVAPEDHGARVYNVQKALAAAIREALEATPREVEELGRQIFVAASATRMGPTAQGTPAQWATDCLDEAAAFFAERDRRRTGGGR